MGAKIGAFVFVALLSVASGAGAVPTYEVVAIGPQIPGATAGAATAVNQSGDAVWDGRNTVGRRVTTGVYLLRLEAGSERKTERVVRIR